VIFLQIPKVLNVNGVNGIRQTETHTAEPLLPEPSNFEIEMTTGRP
jgi:hypothetical protein